MKHKIRYQMIVAFIFTLLPGLVMAKDMMHNEQVYFDKGTTGTTIKGKIKGYKTYNYKLGAKEGQYMRVSLETKHTATYFNIYEPGKGPGDAAMFIGTTQGHMYTGNLPANGTYTIQVFMMRSAARRDEVSHYQLHVGID